MRLLSPETLGIAAFVGLGLFALLSARKRASTLRDYVAAQGWTYLGTSNPVPAEEWKAVCQDEPALLWRKNFILDICRDTEFLVFETRWVETEQR